MYRTATRADLDLILSWAAAEGWNPGTEDAAAFLAADPQGFFVAIHDSQPVAAISVVNHEAGNAFLGLYLCLPDYRGQGIGFGLWQHALRHAEGRAVALDGVAAQQDNYARSGFVLTGATRRWEGSLSPASDTAVRRATAADFADLLALDRAATGIDRRNFVGAWVAPVVSRRTVALDQNGRITGFATIRRCGRGCKIGPVIAPTADAALTLIRAALTVLPATEAIVDVPEGNRDLAQLLQAAGFQNSFTTARMVRGTPPVTQPTLQAIATMELG